MSKKYETVTRATDLAMSKMAPFTLARYNYMYELIYSWYCNSDITDIEILAACGLAGEFWSKEKTYQDMISNYNYWFPKKRTIEEDNEEYLNQFPEYRFRNETSIENIKAAEVY